MTIYNQEIIREKIKLVLDAKYERMYPFELEKELSPILKEADDNKNEEIKQEIFWEIDLLNRAFGHKGTYEGKEVSEISNKWKYFLDTGEFKPLVNLPFCEWKEEAVDYYKRRYEQTENNLAKARYAFAIMVFSSGKDKLDWMLKSVDNWQKSAEKYISDEVFNKEYYEVPPFAYEFAIKLSLSFGKKDVAKKSLESLHNTIKTILDTGEKRWHLEFFEVESKYINSFDTVDNLKKESTDEIKKIIQKLEKDFKESQDKHKSNHFIRSHLKILLNYKTEDDYLLNKQIAESFVSEADGRGEPLVKSSFLNDAIKKYKEMQSRFGHKKDEIQEKIDMLILKIKEINSKISYKQIQTKIEITKEQTEAYISFLKSQNHNLLFAFLDDMSLFPKYSDAKKNTEDQKKQFPLQFMIPITIYNNEEPIMRITSENDIFDYHIRKNILLGLKIGEIMSKITIELLKKEIGDSINETIVTLLGQEQLAQIEPTLKTGFDYIFSDKKDYIAGLHIITPYIEEVIRLIVKKAGKVEVVLEQHKTKFFRGIELGGLLSDKNVENLIGLDFQKSLKVMFVDNDQSNLRNELLHGRLSSKKISESQVIFVGYCLLKLLKILQETKHFKEDVNQ